MKNDANNKIKILDTATANQIAAGEVVERPASVLKELVENAIDAGANRITVKIKNAGVSMIQVIDNGSGMSPDDMVRSLLPHATSKISRIEDLQMLHTLGFRGEALSAISSVSKIVMSSKQPAAAYGYKMTAEAGKATVPEEAGLPDGTSVTVEELFFNTPARKKFLKSNAAEIGQISDYMSRLAISRPHIAFTLQSENKILLKTNGSGDLAQVLTAIYGNTAVSRMVKVDYMQNMMVNGMISLPDINRSNRHHYNFFINNRWVRSKELTQAVDEAYHTLIPQGRYPIVVLFLSMAPSMVDINVHPSKLEIKLKDAEQVINFVKTAVSESLRNKNHFTPHFGKLNTDRNEGFRMEERRRIAALSPNDTVLDKAEQISNQESARPKEPNIPVWKQQPALIFNKEKFNNTEPEKFIEQEATASPKEFIYSSLMPLGQAAGTYIVAAGEDGLYLIDQHAAAERLQYEKFRERADSQTGSATLSMPATIELTHQESLWLTSSILELDRLGFLVEHFGDNTFIIRGVPSWYDGSVADRLLLDVIAAMSDTDKKNSLPNSSISIMEEKLFSMACKSAIKGNQYLTSSDITALFEQLDKAGNAFTCPHGRPITIKLTYAEIERRFLRTGV